jgi:hypothetical protein
VQLSFFLAYRKNLLNHQNNNILQHLFYWDLKNGSTEFEFTKVWYK